MQLSDEAYHDKCHCEDPSLPAEKEGGGRDPVVARRPDDNSLTVLLALAVMDDSDGLLERLFSLPG